MKVKRDFDCNNNKESQLREDYKQAKERSDFSSHCEREKRLSALTQTVTNGHLGTGSNLINIKTSSHKIHMQTRKEKEVW